MKICRILGIALLACASPGVAAPVEMVQGHAPDGTRFYEDSLVIAASPAALFRGFSDPAEFRKWAAPISAVDFRLGGIVEASYDPAGHIGGSDNIRQAIIAYVPDRLIVFRNVQAPSGLPGRDVYPQTVKVIEFADRGDGTTCVTISGIGFGSGRDFDKLYAFFQPGDGAVLKALDAAYGSRK